MQFYCLLVRLKNKNSNLPIIKGLDRKRVARKKNQV